jgi:hypothetical protein
MIENENMEIKLEKGLICLDIMIMFCAISLRDPAG